MAVIEATKANFKYIIIIYKDQWHINGQLH